MDILAEINRVMELEGRTLAKLRAAVGPAYEKAVRLIFDCPGKVILTGIGKSGIIAQKIASTLVSTGTPAMFLHPLLQMAPDQWQPFRRLGYEGFEQALKGAHGRSLRRGTHGSPDGVSRRPERHAAGVRFPRVATRAQPHVRCESRQ